MEKIKNTIWIIPIEPIDQRYTAQWYENIPKLLKSYNEMYVVTIDGNFTETGTTPGAFLDFGKTNEYKASQIVKVSQLFSEHKIQPGDHFLITDAWNFAATSIKYMSELLNIPVKLHGIWHAGAYDPTDILGMKMSKNWPDEQERAWFYCYDWNYFATNFHKHMFLSNRNIPVNVHHRAKTSGQPHNHIVEHFSKLKSKEKTDTLVWPHRYNDDKQPRIIEDLKTALSDKLNVVITQQENLSKTEYYDLLNTSKIVFSCSLHENLGISQMEGTLAGCIPIMPNRASYTEMYAFDFIYPSNWTIDWYNYQYNKESLINFILDNLSKYYEESTQDTIKKQQQILKQKYLTADVMFSNIINKL